MDDFLDGLKFNRFHLTVLILCTILTAIDGYELYVVGWVLPVLAKDFGVAPTAITSALVAQQVGMLLGAFVIPPLADRIGRPRLLLFCYFGMMLSALAILFTNSLLPFTICRFAAGFCGTAMIPILVTLASETAPKRLRATVSTITVSGTMIGALAGALMQRFILEPYGWRGAFWIAVVLPAIMLPFIYFLLPESLRALVSRNPHDPAIPALIRKMQPEGEVPAAFTVVPKPARAPTAIAGSLNVGAFQQEGIDMTLNYRTSAGFLGEGGKYSLSASGTYIFKALVDAGTGAAPIDRSGENGWANLGSIPELRANLSQTIGADAWELTLQTIFISAGKQDVTYNTLPTNTINNNRVPPVTYFNLYGKFFAGADKRYEFFWAVNNLLDKDPPPTPYNFMAGVRLKF